METEIIKTDDPNIIIARTTDDRVINIEEIRIQIEGLTQHKLGLISQRLNLSNEVEELTSSTLLALVHMKLVELDIEIRNLENTIQNLNSIITY